MTESTLTHAEIDELLPMLVAGTLSDAQSESVRKHLATCLDCRREQRHLALVRDGVREAPQQVDMPHPNPARVLERIERYEDRRRRNPLLRFLQFGRDHPFMALAAQAALILLAVFLLVSPIEPEPQFVTLSQPGDVPAGQYVRAVFEPALDRGRIENIIVSMNLEIVHGPTDRGVYTLGSAVDRDSTNYMSLADTLRERDGVMFAEPVTVGGAR